MLDKLIILVEKQDSITIRRFLYGLIAAAFMILATQAFNAYSYYQGKRLTYQSEFEEMLWVKEQGETIRSKRESIISTETTGNDTLVSIVTSTAKNHDLVVSRYRPDGDAGVQLWIEDSPVSDILQWIDELLSVHSVKVSGLSLSKSDQLGYANIQLDINSTTEPRQ